MGNEFGKLISLQTPRSPVPNVGALRTRRLLILVYL